MLKRFALSLGVFAGAFLVLQWTLGEVAVCYEMAVTGFASRAELGDDFGLGLLLLLVVVPASLIGAIIASTLVWRALGRRPKQGRSEA